MHSQSDFHRYRISVIQGWPEGACKQSALAAANAALERELHHERSRGLVPTSTVWR
jgi:hypothetical protein